MAIARNRRTTPAPAEAAAIAAFGSAAEARPGEEAPVAATPIATPRAARETATPKTSLIRWTDEELRAQIAEYSRRERYSMQHVMIEALRLGMQQLDRR